MQLDTMEKREYITQKPNRGESPKNDRSVEDPAVYPDMPRSSGHRGICPPLVGRLDQWTIHQGDGGDFLRFHSVYHRFGHHYRDLRKIFEEKKKK